MRNIVKLNFLTHQPFTYISFFLFILLATFINIPGSFTFVVVFFATIISLFIYDNRQHVQRFTLSLPISKNEMVIGRYLYSLAIITATLLIIWGWMNILSLTPLPLDDRYFYHWQDVIALFAIGSVMLTISIPLLYALSFSIATLIIAIGFFIGFFLYISTMVDSLQRGSADFLVLNDVDAGLSIFIEKLLPFQPYLLLIIGSIIILYLSMKLSTFIVKRKDI